MKLFHTVLAACAAVASVCLPSSARADDILLSLPPVLASGKGEPSHALQSVAGDTANAGANWLADEQQPSGAFPWTAGQTAVYSNTQGATALSLVRAYGRNGRAADLAAAQAVAACMQARCISGMSWAGDGGHRFATHDPLFLVELSSASGDPGPAAYLDAQLWTPLASGTYGDADLDAGGYADAVLTSRTTQGIPELAAWDLSKLAIAAHLAGETAARDAFMARIEASLEAAGPTSHTYDVIGLAGAVWASTATGVGLDPAVGTWAAADSTADLAAALAGFRAPGGGFVTGSGEPLVDASASIQSTAFALLALHAADPVAYAPQVTGAYTFIASLQQPGGQFLAYIGASPSEGGSVESHAEALEAYAVTRLSTDRYVDATGTDSGDCSQQALPCRTIQYAVNQANEGNTIHIASGSYFDPVTIATGGLRLVGEGATRPVLDRNAGSTNQSLLVITAPGTVIERLQFDADRSLVGEGVLCVGGCTSLTVLDSVFRQRRSSATTSSYGRTNAISAGVFVSGYPGAAGPVELRVQGTQIVTDPATLQATAFRAGVALNGGFGTIGGDAAGEGNDIASTNHDVLVTSPRGGDVLVAGNQLRGLGVQLTTPAATAGSLVIRDNLLQPLLPVAVPTPADHSAMRLISNANGVPVLVSGNIFIGHERGVLVENFPAVTLHGNSFTPPAGSSTFRHLVVGNKELFTNNPPPQPLSQSLTLLATGNTFNASSIGGTGEAVTLLNDNAQGEPAGGYFGSLVFGASGAANAFVGDFGRYFALGNFSCADSNVEPCPLAWSYAAAIGAARGTPVVPFAGDVSALHNTFDGVAPADMSPSQRNVLLARTQDSASDPQLGTVDYGIEAIQEQTFADDDFAGAAFGTPFTFVHPDPAVDGRTVFAGIDAFGTISAAMAAVEAGGEVYVAAGSYTEGVAVAKPLQVIGAGSDAAGSVVQGALSFSISGTEAEPLRVGGLRIANPVAGGHGLALAGVAHVSLEGVAFVGHDVSGVNFAGTGVTGISFSGPGCLFEGNAVGVRHATTAIATDVHFDDCQFVDNGSGIILFGASGSGNGQIADWSVSDSVFRGNNADNSGFGGGIWIKTGGAGSLVDGFSVSGTLFEDNGSTNPLNGVGITVRARPGTTLANVMLCDNTYRETAAPGSQAYGVLVFDQTGNTGYSPVTVCNSQFDGVAVGVSGAEQAAQPAKTQPVVLLSGNTTLGDALERQFVNDPVRNLDTGESFPTIGAAMADGDTAADHTIALGIGVYTENVVVPHPGMTLTGVGPASEIAGTNLPGSGVAIPMGRDRVSIVDLAIRDFAMMSSSAHACLAADRVNNLLVRDLVVSNCKGGRAGIYANGVGGIDGITIAGNEVSDVGPIGARGIVVWNGFKTNISIQDNYVHDIAGCCGIELQDGTASGVTVTGNRVERTGDNGIGLVGLKGGAGGNLVADNTISDVGRFGIEIKLPEGSGLDSGDGSIVVEGNTVSQSAPMSTLKPGELRDTGGIVVIRRDLVVSEGNADIPSGVIVRGNVVSGFVQDAPGSSSTGFGIVLEGVDMRATGNTVSGNEVGIQRQQGHLPYVAGTSTSGDQSNLADDYFGRGNSPLTCALVQGNVLSGNDIDTRDIGGDVAVAAINLDSGDQFCSIQAAIDAASAGQTVSVLPGLHQENVVVNKPLTLRGPFAATAGYHPARDGTGEAVVSATTGQVIRVLADGVIVEGLTVTGLSGAGNAVGLASGGNFGGNANSVIVRNNRFVDLQGSGIYTNGPTRLSDWLVVGNLVQGITGEFFSGINLWKVDDAEIEENVVRDVGFGGIQVNTNSNVKVHDNLVEGTGNNGINIGHGTDGVQVYRNTVRAANNDGSDADEGALTLYGGASNVAVYCNTFDASGGSNGITTKDEGVFLPDEVPLGAGIAIFHNAILGTASLSHSNSLSALAVGSNWYGDGAPATVAGDAAGALSVADPLPATPIGQAACGDNTPAAIQAHAGSPQATSILAAFAAPLQARVVDALGGAVEGAAVAFTVPAAGASAALDAPLGSTDFNGLYATPATANGIAGSYEAVASHAGFSADFALTNDKGVGTVVFGPLSGVYDGSPQGTSASVQEDPSASCSVTPTSSANVGDYTIEATCSGDNYTASAQATYSITRRPVVIVLSNLGPHAYSGSAFPAAASAPDQVAGDTLDITLTYDGSATAPSAVGSYVVRATLDPAANPNYSAEQALGSLVIDKAASTVTIDAADLQQSFGATFAVDASAAPVTAGVGEVQVTYDGSPAVPTEVGTYAVLATLVDPSYEGVASATLVVADDASVSLSLDPVTVQAFVETPGDYTGFVDFSGTLENAGAATAQPVHYLIHVVRVDDGNGTGGMPVGIIEDDVKACLYDPSGWAAQEDAIPGFHDGCPQDYEYLFSQPGTLDGRPSVQFRYPNLATNDLPLPAGFATALAPGNLRLRHGEYLVRIDVVGSSDGRVYASATTNSTSVPDVTVAYSGATSGPAESLLLSTSTLRNDGGRATQPVRVRVTLSDAAATDAVPVALSPGDAEFFYQVGDDYLPLAWEAGNAPDGGLVTWFGPAAGFALEDGHDATTAGAGLFHRTGAYRLRYEVVDVATQSVPYASSEVAVDIDASAVNFALSDLAQVYDGTPRAITVSALPNGASWSVSYAPASGACPADIPAEATSSAPVDAGSYCVWVQATGNYSGSASGLLVVAPAPASIALDPASLSVVFDGAAHHAIATTTPLGLPVALSYDGATNAPIAVGSYVVIATVTDPNYSGGTSGVLTIAPADAAIAFGGDVSGAVTTASSTPLYTHSSATTSVSGTLPAEPVRAWLTVSRTGGIALADASVEYLAATQEHPSCVAATPSGFWCPLPLSDNGDGTLGAAFGPSAGFPLTDGATSYFRTRWQRGGSYHSSVRLVGVDSGETHALGAGTIDVAQLGLLASGPASAGTGVAVDTSVTLSNAGTAGIGAGEAAPLDENVIGRFVIAAAGGTLAPAEVDVRYLAPDGSYQPIALAACGTGALCGDFGPASGFPVAAGGLSTSQFRTTFLRADDFTVDSQIVGVDSGAVFAEAIQSAAVTASSASIGIDPASLVRTYNGAPKAVLVSTSPAGLDYTVTYDGSSTPPTDAGSYEVVATITQPGYSGSSTAELVIARATAQVSLSALTQLYDGTPRAVVVSTAPAALAVTITYDGNVEAPVGVGSYAVHAEVTDGNYQGAAAGTLTVLAAAVSGFTIEGAQAFAGVAGAPLEGALPTVRVTDTNGDGVHGLSVRFTALDGDIAGEASAVVATDADGVASVPAWTLDRDAGDNSLEAQVVGLAGLPVRGFVATGSEQADVAMQKTATQGAVQQGELVDYVLAVSNTGPSNASAVDVVDALPVGLDGLTAAWSCVAAGGASCNGTAAGTGDVAIGATIPVGGSITVLLSAAVREDAPLGDLANTASASLASGVDPQAGNDASTATVEVLEALPLPSEIFEDGFEGDAGE